MKKGFLSFFLFTAFALALCPSCKDDETAEWKNVAFSVASNLAPENGTIPYEGSTVVFTVTTDGKWTYAIDQSKTDWFTHPTVDGMTLAILIPENTVSRERSGVVRFISVSDPTLVEEFTITQEPGPVPPEAPKADLLDVVFHADGTAEDVSPLKNEVLSYPGTALTLAHTAPTPVCMVVHCDCELTAVEDRRLHFTARVYDDVTEIAAATHERYIVDNERFTRKANSKLTAQS